MHEWRQGRRHLRRDLCGRSVPFEGDSAEGPDAPGGQESSRPVGGRRRSVRSVEVGTLRPSRHLPRRGAITFLLPGAVSGPGYRSTRLILQSALCSCCRDRRGFGATVVRRRRRCLILLWRRAMRVFEVSGGPPTGRGRKSCRRLCGDLIWKTDSAKVWRLGRSVKGRCTKACVECGHKVSSFVRVQAFSRCREKLGRKEKLS